MPRSLLARSDSAADQTMIWEENVVYLLVILPDHGKPVAGREGCGSRVLGVVCWCPARPAWGVRPGLRGVSGPACGGAWCGLLPAGAVDGDVVGAVVEHEADALQVRHCLAGLAPDQDPADVHPAHLAAGGGELSGRYLLAVLRGGQRCVERVP